MNRIKSDFVLQRTHLAICQNANTFTRERHLSIPNFSVYNVAVIDCDYPQHSIFEMRKRDFKMVDEDEYYKGMAYEQITKLEGKKILFYYR